MKDWIDAILTPEIILPAAIGLWMVAVPMFVLAARSLVRCFRARNDRRR